MKKKIFWGLAVIMYLCSISLLIFYFAIEFNKSITFSPIGRVVALVLSCILMYIGGIILSKNVSKKYQEKPLKINITVWFILYIILLSTLTLFDDYFYRGNFAILGWNKDMLNNYMQHSFNIIPFTTIVPYIINFIKGNAAPYIFVYNIIGNVIALMPFAFFLPLLFEKQKRFKTFLCTMIGIVIGIEILQFITFSGSCDIDDVILNTLGACLMFAILRSESIKNIIENIFLLKHYKVEYKDLIKKVTIIIIPIVIIAVGVVIGARRCTANERERIKEANIEAKENSNQMTYINGKSIKDLPKEIPIEYAVNEGYFVYDGSKDNSIVYNKDVLDRFIINTRVGATNRIADKIRIIVYNYDGFPSIYDLEYKIFEETYINEEQKEVHKSGYILTTDATRNNIIPRDIFVNDNIPGQFYGIKIIEDEGVNVASISLCLYAEIDYIDPSIEPYKHIEIARYLLDSEVINKREVNPNLVTTIDIQNTGLSSVTPIKKCTLNQEEIYVMFEIINNLTFTKETCDGIADYYIKLNTDAKENYQSYGIEVYSNQYHIVSRDKGEAILTQEQTGKMKEIINKYYK